MFEIDDGPEPPDDDDEFTFQRSPSVYDKQYFISLIASLLRVVLAGAGAWFVEKGVGTQGQWEFLLAGVALFLVTLASVLYSKYKNRLHFLAALSASPAASDEDIKKHADVLAEKTLERRE